MLCDKCDAKSGLFAWGWEKVHRDARFPIVYTLCPSCAKKVRAVTILTQWVKDHLLSKVGPTELDRFYSEDISWNHAGMRLLNCQPLYPIAICAALSKYLMSFSRVTLCIQLGRIPRRSRSAQLVKRCVQSMAKSILVALQTWFKH